MADTAVPDFCEALTGFRYWRYIELTDGHSALNMKTEYRLETGLKSAKELWTPHQAQEAQHRDWNAFYSIYDKTALEAAARTDVIRRQSCDGPPCRLHNSTLADGTRFRPGCGIYAAKDLNRFVDIRMRDYGAGADPMDLTSVYAPLVVGEVWLWGRVAEHALGYLAQFAYPKNFIAATEGPDVASELARVYGVPFQEDPRWRSEPKNDGYSSNPYRVPFLFDPNAPLNPSLAQSQLSIRHIRAYDPASLSPPSYWKPYSNKRMKW